MSTPNNDLIAPSLQVVAAYLSNPNTRIEPSALAEVIRSVHNAVQGLASEAVPALPAPAAPAPAPAQPAAPDAEMSPEARASLAGSAVVVGGSLGEPGANFTPNPWQGIPAKTRRKFERLIEEHNLQLGPDGYPIPRRPRHRLISEDGLTVADPITGTYLTMLKRHLRVKHDLDHQELLAMFGLDEKELPRSGPTYSQSKAEQAKLMGLGKHRSRPAPEPEPVSKGSRRSARPAAAKTAAKTAAAATAVAKAPARKAETAKAQPATGKGAGAKAPAAKATARRRTPETV